MSAKTEYPESRQAGQFHYILKFLFERGPEGLTHTECEELTAGLPCGKCTTLRSGISTLKRRKFWPIISKAESHGVGSHARYYMDFNKLAEDAGVGTEMIPIAVRDWNNSGRVFTLPQEFIEFLSSGYRRLVENQPKELDLFNDWAGRTDLNRHGGKA